MKRPILIPLVVLLVSATVLQGADKFIGVWTLNVAKSTYSPGKPPKSQKTQLLEVKNGIREIVDRVNADGTTTHWDYTAMFDGKDHPVSGDPDRDMASIKRIDDRTLEVVNKKAGKVTTSMTISVAKDGKTRTNTVTGQTAAGVAIRNVLLFDLEPK